MFRFILLFFWACVTYLSASEKVFLLHGLARTSRSMRPLEDKLISQGYTVVNIDYPSRKHPVTQLSRTVRATITRHLMSPAEPFHVVTHSMGGIILRHIQRTNPLVTLERVVMLSPPNQGSEVVDKLGAWKLFDLINGPAGQQLGTADSGFIQTLGDVDFELGVLTCDRSINPLLSLLIPDKDDGKVSVERAKVKGMKAFKVIHATHPLIMRNKEAHENILAFLQSGVFVDSE